jgi:hypothetical protein
VTAELVPAEEFKEVFRRFDSYVFRFEALQRYTSPDEEAIIEAFRERRPRPPDPGKEEWASLVRAGRDDGRVFQRVHVVTEPLTDYMRFELTWGYAPNVAAGEDIRIVPVRPGESWPDDLPRHDFWLFDAAQLYATRYHPDGTTWLGVERIRDPDDVLRACRWRETALELGVPWVRYLEDRPELAALLNPSTTAHQPS